MRAERRAKLSIQIDKEFEALIPRLTDEEFSQLEKNVIEDGCRDALVLWEDILVDGHNRYRICQKHGIPFNTVQKEFANRDKAREWIILNQFGRRNLTAFQRSELALQLKPVVKAEAKSNLVVSTGGANPRPLQKSEKVAPIHTDERIAKVAGVSRDTLRKAEVIKEEGTSEQIQRARKGGQGNTVNAIFREIMESKADPDERKTCIKCGAEKALTDFYPGRNVCKSCINTRHQYRDAKGEPVHISEEAQALEKQYGEKTINDLYDQDREIVYGIDDLAEELGAIADTYIRQTGDCLSRNRGLMEIDENTKKIMTVLSEAETAIRKIRKEYFHE